MTKTDFIAHQKELEKRSKRLEWIWFIFFFCILVSGILFSPWMDKHKSLIYPQVIFLILLFGFLLGSIPFFLHMSKRHIKELRLFCPACNEPLTRLSGQVAIATDHCGHCGAAVFKEVVNDALRAGLADSANVSPERAPVKVITKPLGLNDPDKLNQLVGELEGEEFQRKQRLP